MPATDEQLLYGLGPFGTMQPGRPGVYVPIRPFAQGATTVDTLNNIDTHRLHGAATTGHGRINLTQLPALGNIQTLIRYDVGPFKPYWIAQDGAGNINYYDQKDATIYQLMADASIYSQGVQDDGNIFFNNGTQAWVIPDGLHLKIGVWQPGPISTSGIDVDKVPFSNSGLTAETYYYAFTIVTSIPTVNGTIQQESVAVGANAPYPYSVTLKPGDVPNTAVQINTTGGGVNADGNSYKVRIYRQSTNQPNWFAVALTPNAAYIDSKSDQSISGNIQLLSSTINTPPPVGNNQLWPIAEYLNRMWIFTIVTNAGTNNVPQTQLWYSNVGQGWSFDPIAQVLPVGNENTSPEGGNTFTNPPVYGAEPVALSRFGSLLIAFRNGDSWFVTGQDENTFQVIPLFDTLGCGAQYGPVSGRGILAWPANNLEYWTFDGANLSYISDDLYELTQGINPTAWSQQVGFYWNEYFCWSFPNLQFTLRWHSATGQWDKVPYATIAVATAKVQGANALNASLSPPYNQAVAVRASQTTTSSNILDSWFADPVMDLGLPITGTIIGPASDTMAPANTKTLRWIVLHGPVQAPGTTATVTLHRDFDSIPIQPSQTAPPSPTVFPSFDLSQPPPWIIQIPSDSSQCTTFSIDVALTTAPGATAPAQLWKAEVYGQISREMALKV